MTVFGSINIMTSECLTILRQIVSVRVQGETGGVSERYVEELQAGEEAVSQGIKHVAGDE